MAPLPIGLLTAPIQEEVNEENMTAAPSSNLSTIAQKSHTMAMNSAINDMCGRCDKMIHTDKTLADQCRLMTAMLGPGWGKVDDGDTQGEIRITKEHKGLSTNSLDILMRAVKDNSRVLINFRNKMLLG